MSKDAQKYHRRTPGLQKFQEMLKTRKYKKNPKSQNRRYNNYNSSKK